MPRISAPTLAEHRDMRRNALLTAGRDLALEGGPRAVTMAAVAERAGLSRPAVYEYFESSDALLGELLLDEMRRWSEDLVDAVTRARSPRDKVRAYIRTSLRMVADGRHSLSRVAPAVSLPPAIAARIGELHRSMAAPLAQALSGLGAPDPDEAAQLLQGTLQGATRRIEAGGRLRSETQAVETFVLAGIQALAAGGADLTDADEALPDDLELGREDGPDEIVLTDDVEDRDAV